ncbi:MAG: hypothetical protein AB1498_02075 [bacterium]
MKKIFLLIFVIISAGLAYAQNLGNSIFDKNKFEKILPVGWHIETIRENEYPYGFIENTNNNGLSIFLKGSVEVKDKGQSTKESISIWIMPLNYSANKASSPGPSHLSAKLIGKNNNSNIFVLLWSG